jgi:signal transduction histidine kinase
MEIFHAARSNSTFTCTIILLSISIGALRHIIINLFGNAQKCTDSGSIWVSLTAEDVTNSIPKGEKLKSHASSAVILTIQDSGRGMSVDFLNKSLYTPFTQEDTFASGIGLGLSIV